jgi:hypothetical protein
MTILALPMIILQHKVPPCLTHPRGQIYEFVQDLEAQDRHLQNMKRVQGELLLQCMKVMNKHLASHIHVMEMLEDDIENYMYSRYDLGPGTHAEQELYDNLQLFQDIQEELHAYLKSHEFIIDFIYARDFYSEAKETLPRQTLTMIDVAYSLIWKTFHT